MEVTKYLLETPRLRIRYLTGLDFEEMMAVYGDPLAMRWVDDGKPIEKSECRRWISVTLDNYARRGYGMFTVEEKEYGAVVGFCGLVHPGGQDVPELKYALKQQFWGCGLATEIVRAVLAYAGCELNMDRIIATVDPDNIASQRVVTKGGMHLLEVVSDESGLQTQVYEWLRQ